MSAICSFYADEASLNRAALSFFMTFTQAPQGPGEIATI
jgi:hypothetical protein